MQQNSLKPHVDTVFSPEAIYSQGCCDFVNDCCGKVQIKCRWVKGGKRWSEKTKINQCECRGGNLKALHFQQMEHVEIV